MTSAPSFRLLPVELTEAMRFAMHAAVEKYIGRPIYEAFTPVAWCAALSAAPVMTEATGWQPIETAPRDGTPFLALRLEEDGTPTCNVVFYDGDNSNRDFIWALVEGAFYHKEWPSHWMPLPDPPALNAAIAVAAGQLGEKESGDG